MLRSRINASVSLEKPVDVHLVRFTSIGSFLFLFALPILSLVDNATGFFGPVGGRSISFLFRVFLMTAMAIVLLKSGYQNSLFLLTYFVFLFVPILFRMAFDFEYSYASIDLNRAVKTAYGVIVTSGFYSLLKNHRGSTRSALTGLSFAAFLYAFVVFASNVTGIGLSQYGGATTSGFVAAGNDLSLMLSVGGPLVLTSLSQTRKSQVLRLVFVMFYSFVLLSLFTKSGLLGAVILWIAYINEEKNTKSKVLIIFVFLFLLFLLLPIIKELFESFLSIYGVLIRRDGVVGLLFRGRDQVLLQSETIVNALDMSLPEILFGPNFGSFGKIYASSLDYWLTDFKNAEMDPIDLFFAHGLFGSVATLGFYAFWTKKAYGNMRKKFGIDTRWSILIWWIHSVFAGHAISTPIVMTHMAVVFSVGRIMMNESCRQEREKSKC